MPSWLPSLVWLAVLIVSALVEGATVALVSVWFCAGALAALLCAIAGGSVGLQVFLFSLVSLLAMAILRPLARKYVLPHRVPTNADRVIGREAMVTEAIDNLSSTGAVLIFGTAWTARSATGEPIPKGTAVTVQRIEGVKLYVAPATQN